MDLRFDQHLGASFTGHSRATSKAPPAPGHPASEVLKLRRREHEVLWLLADGATTPDTATTLGIAETTAQAHMAAVKRRLGARTRAQAVALAMRAELFDERLTHGYVWVGQAIRDATDHIADIRLIYLGHELRRQEPRLTRCLGAPLSTRWPRWPRSALFDLGRHAVEHRRTQETNDARPPWAPDGPGVAGLAIPLGHDRVIFRTGA